MILKIESLTIARDNKIVCHCVHKCYVYLHPFAQVNVSISRCPKRILSCRGGATFVVLEEGKEEEAGVKSCS